MKVDNNILLQLRTHLKCILNQISDLDRNIEAMLLCDKNRQGSDVIKHSRTLIIIFQYKKKYYRTDTNLKR